MVLKNSRRPVAEPGEVMRVMTTPELGDCLTTAIALEPVLTTLCVLSSLTQRLGLRLSAISLRPARVFWSNNNAGSRTGRCSTVGPMGVVISCVNAWNSWAAGPSRKEPSGPDRVTDRVTRAFHYLSRHSTKSLERASGSFTSKNQT
ncbi:hypothetical protein EVAR_92175_1 [Eumeta japonica]|uniref:Uncharacterized protein n=1 Tax=Eumeta variegata TaxID=151549 RepID=A0A4C1T1F3_EUMVA|nr:hypothetical protein EVAR_92175_1 [Eumeta japonica]